MDINFSQFDSINGPEDIRDDSLVYMISINGTEKVDRKVTIDQLTDKLLGNVDVSVLKNTDTFSVRQSDRTPKSATIDQLDKYMFGDKKLTADKIFIRAVDGENPNNRGYVDIETIVKDVVTKEEDTNTITDKTKTRVKLKIDGKNYNIPYEEFEDIILSKENITNIENADKLFIKLENGTKAFVSVSNLISNILPTKLFDITEMEDNDNILYSKTIASAVVRGNVTLKSVVDKVAAKLDIPTYTTDDNVTAHVHFLYKDGDKFGYISRTGMQRVIFENDTIDIDDTLLIRGVNGTNEGIFKYTDVEKKILDKVDAIYKIDAAIQEINMNDGDGFIFLNNGENPENAKYKNISFNTVKNKILNNDTNVTIQETTKIYVETGYITYGELKNKLHKDIFGG